MMHHQVANGAPAIQESAARASTAALRAEHAGLEVRYERLLDAYRLGDWNDVHAEWALFESTLRAHMAREESTLFGTLRAVDPEEVAALVAEHVRLRELLDVLGLNVELHVVTATDARALVEQLRAHRVREEQLLYPWTDAAQG